MNEAITSFVGLDVHKDSVAIAVAEAGRAAPHFVGTVSAQMSALCKALRRVRSAEHTLVVYELARAATAGRDICVPMAGLVRSLHRFALCGAPASSA